MSQAAKEVVRLAQWGRDVRAVNPGLADLYDLAARGIAAAIIAGQR